MDLTITTNLLLPNNYYPSWFAVQNSQSAHVFGHRCAEKVFCLQSFVLYSMLWSYCYWCRYCKVIREKAGQLHEKDLEFTNPKFSSAALYSATKYTQYTLLECTVHHTSYCFVRMKTIKVDKNKFLAVASCGRKEFQSIVDIMMEYNPTDDSKCNVVLWALFTIMS